MTMKDGAPDEGGGVPMQPSGNSILTTAQVMALLGCSRKFLLDKTHEGRFPNAFRVGAHWRFLGADVLAFREASRVHVTSDTAGS